jgi:hypothetical protein
MGVNGILISPAVLQNDLQTCGFSCQIFSGHNHDLISETSEEIFGVNKD